MARKLLDNQSQHTVSPLIDVVMNAFAAMFILLMVYMMVARVVPPPPRIEFLADVALPPAIRGQSYIFTFPVIGGVGERTFALSGTLPDNLRFHPRTGTIYGVPMMNQHEEHESINFSLQVEVRDTTGRDMRMATLTLHPIAVPYDKPLRIIRDVEELPSGRVGVPYEVVLGATGGVEPYLWQTILGDLPEGLTLRDGRILGTPQKAGSFKVTVQVRHNWGTFTHQDIPYTWEAEEKQKVYQLMIIEPLRHSLHLPEGRVGESYFGFVSTNGTLAEERMVWTETNVPGLEFSDDERTLRGMPSEAGTYEVAYQIINGTTHLGTGTGNIHILPKRPDCDVSSALLFVRVGETIRFGIPYRGMIEPVHITPDEPLPAGLRIEGSWIVGTPTEAVMSTISLTIEDAREDARSCRKTSAITIAIWPHGLGTAISGETEVPVQLRSPVQPSQP